MSDAQSLYETIAGKYLKETGVAEGKMMSSPALKFNKKVFVFFHQDKMCFKLGKDFDLTPFGIANFEFLSPFKNKPPMKAWYILNYADGKHWDELTKMALQKIKS